VVLISLVGRPVDEATWGVLAAKYLFPFALFHLAQLVFTEEQRIRRLEVFALVVLAYLSFTAIASLLGLPELVFPKFILDPNLGYHIDRARGPFLQAVANGVSLNMLALLVLHGYRRGSLRSMKTALVLGSVPIATLATMTRSVWLSFAGSLLGLLFIAKNLKARLAFIAVLTVAAGGLGVVMATTDLGGVLGDRLQESAPVEFRKAVNAGGWQMFLERPFVGWGFHQMPAELPKYVSEFHDKVLYPHNTYLEILVENGLLGLSLYAWLMWELWRLGRGKVQGREARGYLDSFRRWWPILLAMYWVNAAVVVMSYQFVNGILFTVAGILAAQRRRAEVGDLC
jgi:putative inorganic carbon (hco3(-)) transporter